ncbi:MAG: VOC family protein [FCB group bacterium]|jgi:catechol 2,3-dioxygenase-like lactoylglutathione lyase family enzyme
MLSITETNVTIMVRDLDISINFYQKIGLNLKKRWEDHYAMMETTGITIGLHPSTEVLSSNKGISIGFMVKDIKEPENVLIKNKIQYEFREGKSGKYLNFKDPDGTELYFTEPGWNY